MGFNRALVSPDAKIPQPLRQGDGLLANFAPAAFAAETDEDLTINQVSGGLIHQGTTLTSDVEYTLPDAADIADEWPEMDVGDAYSFMVTNSQAAAFDVVIAVGTDITAVGANNTLSVPPQCTRIFTLVLTDKTADAETFDLY